MVKVFSFCLYGPPNPRYYPIPMFQNIYLIARYFPDWKVYLYTAPDVDTGFLDQLQQYPNVVLRPTGKLGIINMMERFFAIDEPDVEVMFVRDADSRVHWKDRWAINDFLSKPSFVAHAIRDHEEHTANMMGGMWGIRKSSGLNMARQYKAYLDNPVDHGFGADQSFLVRYVYPYVRNRLLVHVGEGPVYPPESTVRFPFKWSPTLFCGRVDGQNFIDTPQPRETSVLSLLKISR
jgi:hypothetical protein